MAENKKQNNRLVGKRYEQIAAAWLTQQGFTVLAQNYREKPGEIDIIAREKDYLVFLEVKYRATDRYGTPPEAVNRKKQQTIRTVAALFLKKNHYAQDTKVRFDVIGIQGNRLKHIKDAF